MSVQVEIVSAENEIFSGEAEMVFAPAILGEVGIAPGHTPMLTQLGPGEVRLEISDGDDQAFYISGGMLEVQPKVVTILSDTALRAADLDEAAVMKAKEEAERAIQDSDSKMDYATALAQSAEAAAQLQTIQRLRRRSGRS